MSKETGIKPIFSSTARDLLYASDVGSRQGTAGVFVGALVAYLEVCKLRVQDLRDRVRWMKNRVSEAQALLSRKPLVSIADTLHDAPLPDGEKEAVFKGLSHDLDIVISALPKGGKRDEKDAATRLHIEATRWFLRFDAYSRLLKEVAHLLEEAKEASDGE